MSTITWSVGSSSAKHRPARDPAPDPGNTPVTAVPFRSLTAPNIRGRGPRLATLPSTWDATPQADRLLIADSRHEAYAPVLAHERRAVCRCAVRPSAGPVATNS
jgi:hypothetical protein